MYSLVYDLLHYENFLLAINYINLDENEKLYHRSDVRTSTNYIKHKEQMEARFHEMYPNNNDINHRPKVQMINLLISEFYDGVQLFKSRVQNFWP